MISERIRLLAELCPKIQPIVDIGADHGQVARATGAIAVERMPHRIRGRRATEADSKHRFPVLESRPTEPGGPGVNHEMGKSANKWVVADGMTPFRHVGTAIIAGIGARTIIDIIEAGPRPKSLLLHTPDDPPVLRRYLASHGWHIDCERLAREGRRIAEVICASEGEERAEGLILDYGPRLLEQRDPLLIEHLDKLVARWQRIAHSTANRAIEAHEHALAQIGFLNQQLDKVTPRL